MRTLAGMSAIVADIERLLADTLLSPKGADQYERGKVAQAELRIFAERIAEFSASYVACQSPAIRSEDDAAAYALYYLPINLVKVLHLLQRCPADIKTRPLRVLDFGCGPGTASLALLESFPLPTTLTLVDRSPAMLTMSSKLLNAWSLMKNIALVPFSAVLTLETSQEYDLILACNVLNELSNLEQERLCDKLLSQLSSNGVLLLLEPALQSSTRQLMQLRDTLLLKHRNLVPLFPCTHRDACPMLRESGEDWCHGTLQWTAPPLVNQFDSILGFNKHRIKYASLILQRDGHIPEGMRVIGESSKGRAGTEALLCGAEHYGVVRLPKRVRSEANRSFDRLSSYQRVRAAPIGADGTLLEESVVNIID